MDDQILEKYIKQLEEMLLLRRKDDFNRLLSDHFVEYGSSGIIITKRNLLEMFSNDDSVNVSYSTLSNFKLDRLAENAALVTYEAYNEELNRNTLRSSIWKKINGEWQMFFHQGTVKKQ